MSDENGLMYNTSKSSLIISSPDEYDSTSCMVDFLSANSLIIETNSYERASAPHELDSFESHFDDIEAGANTSPSYPLSDFLMIDPPSPTNDISVSSCAILMTM